MTNLICDNGCNAALDVISFINNNGFSKLSRQHWQNKMIFVGDNYITEIEQMYIFIIT